MFTAALEDDASRWGTRKPAFVEDGISIGFKYPDEYFQAISLLDMDETSPKDQSYPRAIRFGDLDESGSFRLTTFKEPECRPREVDEIDFTLVTQSSMDRLHAMKHQCHLWGRRRPISIAVSTDSNSTYVKETLSRLGCDLDYVTVQLLDPSAYWQPDITNVLRNMAMSAVSTSHAVYVDVETVVSRGLYETLLLQRKHLNDPKAALALPTFEFRPKCRKEGNSCIRDGISDVPLSKEDLLGVWSPDGDYEQETVQPFYADFRWGQSSTPFARWAELKNDESLPVDCIEVDAEGLSQWEPFFVVQACRGLPLAQESFKSYGYNKSSWIQELLRRGYTFSVPGGGFVMHLPHPQSASSETFYQEELSEMTSFYRSFGEWIQRVSPNQMKVKEVQAKLGDPFCWEASSHGLRSVTKS